MTRKEILLLQLGEEAAEVAQRASKLSRFGKDEVEPGQELKNSERLTNEYLDLVTLYGMLAKEGILRPLNKIEDEKYAEAKILKVEKYLQYSKDLGILKEENEASQTKETKVTEVIIPAPTV